MQRMKFGLFKKIYSQTDDQDKLWVIYYSYVELCIGYANAVLSSWWRLPPASYFNQHRPLVKLLLTEHDPIISSLVNELYISKLIKQFREKLSAEGWNWEKKHQKLTL